MQPLHEIIEDIARADEEIALLAGNITRYRFPFEELVVREARRHRLSVSCVVSLVQFQDLDYCSNVDDQLICSICLSPMLTPLLTPCGHTFCSECLRRHLTCTNQCPLDRRPIRIRMTQCPQSIVESLDRLIVKCPNAGKGCSHSMKRDEVVTHVLRCMHNDKVSNSSSLDKKD
ncbi:hypothetical protein DER46DRAFT_566466 [Fusarium sp. MPI-SDFR-AT-0072]|nr:hypothetical protein DER46DRAFT_566466 [Fusarium sp. MPI-SDFR-AT-0072]